MALQKRTLFSESVSEATTHHYWNVRLHYTCNAIYLWSLMEDLKYESCLKAKSETFEAMCKRCGACCGSRDGDPCANLAGNEKQGYYCKTYENRLGMQRTVKGDIFNCVPIRELKLYGFIRTDCAYIKS